MEALASAVLLARVVLLAVTVPFTKVEESFNMQAVHDLLVHGAELSSYDHLEFPGVVPRTFWGAALVSAVAKPVTMLLGPGQDWQVVMRITTGVLVWLTHFHFASGVSLRFGSRVAWLLSLVMALQFHLPFYMSRTLPNTFALAACNVGYGLWLRNRHVSALLVFASAMVVFRCDLLVLLAPLTLQFLLSGKVKFWPTLAAGVAASLAALAATVALDSLFWRRWLWPEGTVLFFNTALNKSSEWGTHPWHWYASSALPRALLVSLPLAVVGILGVRRPRLDAPPTSPKTDGSSSSQDGLTIATEIGVCLFSSGVDWALAHYVGPAVAFVSLYSLLPHKELRFLFPVLPLFSLAAAVGLSRLLPDGDGGAVSGADKPSVRTRSARWLVAALVNLGLLALLLLAAAANHLFWVSAAHNYPGGVALKRLVDVHIPAAAAALAPRSQKVCAAAKGVSVHIGVDAAMTGVTRFGHRSTVGDAECTTHVTYSKQEGLGLADLRKFDWLLISPQEAEKLGLLLSRDFTVVETIHAFKRLSIRRAAPVDRSENVVGLPFRVDLEPSVLVVQRRK